MASVDYETETTTLVGGVSLRPNDRFDLYINAAWNQSEASMLPWDIDVDAFPSGSMIYDYTQVYTYSDLDTSRVELGVEASYRFNDRFWLRGEYRWLDFTDDAPYLYDTTGSASFYHLGLGWTF